MVLSHSLVTLLFRDHPLSSKRAHDIGAEPGRLGSVCRCNTDPGGENDAVSQQASPLGDS